jgi:hypothetical protein
MPDPASVQLAATEIVALDLLIVGLLNNAGILQMRPSKNVWGWDMTFATNHLGPFALTEALIPNLPDGANVVFVVSGVEDPERKAAKMAGFRGGRYISAEASARGEWETGGSKMPGERRLFHVQAMHPRRSNGVRPRDTALTFQCAGTRLYSEHRTRTGGQCLPAFLGELPSSLLAPHIKYWSTPKKASRVSAEVLINASGQTDIYYNENAHPMLGYSPVRDTEFQDRVVAETRALLSTIQA